MSDVQSHLLHPHAEHRFTVASSGNSAADLLQKLEQRRRRWQQAIEFIEQNQGLGVDQSK
jgi:lysine/ornithine N-monooxygenase